MKHYYKVTAGPVFETLTVLLLQLNAARDAVVAWAKKQPLPVTGVSYDDVWFDKGFTPDKSAWKKGQRDGAFTPRSKTSEGKRLLEELKRLPKPIGWFDVVMAFSTAYGKNLMMVNSKGAIGFTKVEKQQAFYMQCDPYWLPDDQTGLLEVTAAEFEAHMQS